ncbi:MAG: hypothetical protein ABI846_12630, partial [Rudaea sp.]
PLPTYEAVYEESSSESLLSFAFGVALGRFDADGDGDGKGILDADVGQEQSRFHFTGSGAKDDAQDRLWIEGR